MMRLDYDPDNATRTHRLIFENDEDVERFARTEWLLTDGLGGFAMGTALGMNTRRYHGLLISPHRPPVDRLMLLNAIVISVTTEPETEHERTYRINTFEFAPACIHPQGYEYLHAFERSPASVAWEYRIDDIALRVELAPRWRIGGIDMRFTIRSQEHQPVTLRLAPLMRLDSFHRLNPRHVRSIQMSGKGEGIVISSDAPAGVYIETNCGLFHARPDWWDRFLYRVDAQRGQDSIEDLYTPGEFECRLDINADGTAQVDLCALPINNVDGKGSQRASQSDVLGSARRAHLKALQSQTNHRGATETISLDLLAAADDFIVPRRVGDRASLTILAGYPWFGDWGRDAMIALPGLLIATGRFDDALEVLRNFAAHLHQGLVPNLFDEKGTAAHYNTVDASLWFVHAACRWLQASSDRARFDEHLREACLDIIAWYRRGTDYGIGVDPEDGLVTAGDASTQLTWMDAKRENVVFTPRFGKPVEINALWHHALLSMAVVESAGNPDRAALFQSEAKRVRASFQSFVLDGGQRGLADGIVPTGNDQWMLDTSLRVNQVVALALEHSPLDRPVALKTLTLIEQHLLTPMGLRTLSPEDERYKGRFAGSMFERDRAYHQGTVWPWLIGLYCEAYLRLHGATPASHEHIRKTIEPLLETMRSGPSLGQLFEVFDGDDAPDHRRQPGGCIAQAWSVAAVIHSLHLCHPPQTLTAQSAGDTLTS